MRIRKELFTYAVLISALLVTVPGCSSLPASGPGGSAYIITTSSGVPARQPDTAVEYKNMYGICWNGTNADNLRYAKNMGYKYVDYQTGMENEPAAANMNFYVESPRYTMYWSIFNDWRVQPAYNYSAANKANIEKYFAWKSDAPFPGNIATGWFYNDKDFCPQPDFQQQAVIDFFIDGVVQYVKSKENAGKGFLFAGVTWDVPLLSGDFWSGLSTAGGNQITLQYWTGSDSSVLHPGITHQYATYTEGMAAYYKTLMQRLKAEFPGRQLRFMMEPYNPYNDWVKVIENRADKADLMPDLLYQEGHDMAFADDTRIFASGLVTRDRAGSTTPDVHTEAGNRQIAAKAAVNGSWFNWYGRFGGTGDMINYNNIYDVPAALQLLRVVANWDNLAGVPLSERSWDGATYQSPNSYMDGHVIASRSPYTGKLFVVFLDDSGTVTLNPGETVVSISRADAYFGEADDGSGDLTVSGSHIRLK